MTDTELYEIVKGHREAWPEHVGYSHATYSFECATETTHIMFEIEHAVLMFEASFHRELLKRTAVRVESWPEGFIVRLQSQALYSPHLIEAYAKAMEHLQ